VSKRAALAPTSGVVEAGSSATGSTQSHSRSWWDVHLDLVVLITASVVLALPFIVLSHVNTIDGPAHVLGGRLLQSLHDVPVVRRYYHFTLAVPNVLVPLLLAAAMVVLSPTWAEKVVVALYVVAFPLAVRFAIRSVNREAGWLALIGLPLVVSYLLLFGFYDFSYAMVGAFVAIGLAVRFRGNWSLLRVMALALVLVLTYGAHVVPAVMAVVVIGTLTVVDALSAWRRRGAASGEGAVSRDSVGRVVLPPLLASLPTAALTAAFVASGSAGGLETQRKSFTTLVAGLATLTLPTVTYSDVEIVGAVAVVVILLVLCVVALFDLRMRQTSTLTVGLLVATLVCVVVYFAAPDDVGAGSYLNDRICLFPPLVLLLALASAPVRARAWRVAGTIGLVAALVAAAARLPTQVHYDHLVSEYLTVERAIPPGVTLLAVRYSVFSPPVGSRRYKQLDPLAHEASRVAADRGDIDLADFEALVSFFPDQFRPGVKQLVTRDLYSSEVVPPRVELAQYNQASGRPVQYVLIVGLKGATEQVRDSPDTLVLEQVLAAHYQRVLVTRPTGLVTLYRYRS